MDDNCGNTAKQTLIQLVSLDMMLLNDIYDKTKCIYATHHINHQSKTNKNVLSSVQVICLADGADTERKIIMNMNFKKLAACLMATASLATGMIGTGCISASAANTEDTAYTYGIELDQWLGSQHTDGRRKTNSTSVYVRLDTLNKRVKTQTEGSYDQNYYWTNHTIRNTVTLTNGSWEVYNDIYESIIEKQHYSNAYARVKMWAADSNSTGRVSGVWSPDTAGSYPVAR